MNWGDKAILGIAAQPIAQEFGLSTTQIGLVGTLFYVAFTLTGFSAGWLHRKLTLKWALALLAAIWAAAMLVPVLAMGGFIVILISRIILGLGEGPAAALILSGIYSWHPRAKRGIPSSAAISTSSVASLVIAPLIALVIAAWGWRSAFLILAVLSVAWIALWLTTWKDGPYAESVKASDKGTDHIGDRSVPWRRIFLNRSFIGGAVAMFAAYSIASAALTFAPTYFQKGLGLSQLAAGTLQSVIGAAGLVAMLSAGFIGDRLLARGGSSRVSRGIIPGVAMLIGGVLLAVLVTAPEAATGVAIFAIGYALTSVTIPVLNAGISEVAPPQQLSGTLAVFMGIMYVGAVLAPLVTGAIVDSFGGGASGWGVAWLVFGLLAVVGGASTLVAFNPARDAVAVQGTAAP
jgi:MFS family permease